MRPERYSADGIKKLLRTKTIATMAQIMAALGTATERTVFRKLAQLHCRASYSHRGRFYVLDESPRYDSLGLWSHRSVWFSARGTLVDTAAALVDASSVGYFVDELDGALHVATKDCLRQLVARERLAREQVMGRLLYCSVDAGRRRAQRAARQARMGTPTALAAAGSAPDQLKATIILFLGLLDEKQRRLYAGLESLRLGPRGDALVAHVLGLDPATVAKGRRELEKGEVDTTRLRRPGAGRKALEKKRRNRPPNPGAAER